MHPVSARKSLMEHSWNDCGYIRGCSQIRYPVPRVCIQLEFTSQHSPLISCVRYGSKSAIMQPGIHGKLMQQYQPMPPLMYMSRPKGLSSVGSTMNRTPNNPAPNNTQEPEGTSQLWMRPFSLICTVRERKNLLGAQFQRNGWACETWYGSFISPCRTRIA